MCDHIDIYNLASGATDQGWALGHLKEIFDAENGARGGLRLKDAVDLVVVDYAVNDGHFLNKHLLDRLGLKQTEEDALRRVEAITEYLLTFVLSLPSQPAVIYLETASPEQEFDASRAHVEGARRFGVPVASFRDVLSYPDDPQWITFKNRAVKSKFGFYPEANSNSTNATWKSPSKAWREALEASSSPLREGPQLTVRGKWERPHSFLRCWGDTAHPLWGIHALIAEVLHYFVVVGAAAGEAMAPACERAGKVFKHPLPSSNAKALSASLNPASFCPRGPLSHYNSRDLYFFAPPEKSSPPLALGPNQQSDWALKSDRPGKYGWILESPSGDPARDTLIFVLNISAQPHITVEYMHSFEGQGKVVATLSGAATGAPATPEKQENQHGEPLSPGAHLTIDAHQPDIRYALYTERDFTPVGFLPGPVELRLQLVQLSSEEEHERAGSSFKVASVRSC